MPVRTRALSRRVATAERLGVLPFSQCWDTVRGYSRDHG
jgi:hypothetical protein